MVYTSHIIKMRHLSFDSFCTPDLAPFITLTVSDMKATALLKSKLLLCKDCLSASKNVLCSTNINNWHVQESSTHISHFIEILTRIMHDLSVLSLDSSIRIENGFVDRLLIMGCL